MNEDIRNDIHLVMQHVYNPTGGTDDTEPEEEVIHVHHFPDANIIEFPDGSILFKKSESTQTNIPVVESTPKAAEVNQAPMFLAYLTVCIFIVLMLSSILFQFYVILNPFTVTVTLLARSQQVSLTGTLQLGRLLNPITLSQSQTAPTTGKGHQDARSATGTITFYNGQLNSIFIPAGTILTGNSGEQIVTDADANIPAESGSIPPTLGQTTVPAHAVTPGSKGNIPLGDINQGCCATAIKVVNTTPFSGGQDERSYQVVTKTDITNAAAPLQATLAQSVNGALQGQLKTNEALVTPSCTTTATASNQPGQEATQVKVTVSETCSAVAYNQDTLQAKVTQLLTAQAAKKLETGYSLLGNPQITVTSATTSKQVTLSFSSVSIWVYALSSAEQNNIKKIIAGKTKEKAMQLLLSLPGIESASLQWSGFGDNSRIPKDPRNIHLAIIYGI